ncbi:hypothetical protein ACFO0S_02175 [Chryseomicrobium palamuruense]|uniref:DUF3955 domain-containing protein n=1 Tax=Chryseomicrobium palamuruense TaxID=682973 RepID=A0ABV8URF0_9BACL
MKLKLLFIPLAVTLITIVGLYTIGNLFEISFLRWDYELVIPDRDGFIIEYGGSIIPIIIGIVAGFVSERVLRRRGVA